MQDAQRPLFGGCSSFAAAAAAAVHCFLPGFVAAGLAVGLAAAAAASAAPAAAAAAAGNEETLERRPRQFHQEQNPFSPGIVSSRVWQRQRLQTQNPKP